MTTIITKTAKDGRTIEIKKTGNKLGEVAVYVGGEYLMTGHATKAVVNGRPEITHVINGKIALTKTEAEAISAAYSTEIKQMVEQGRKEDADHAAYIKQYNHIANGGTQSK
jgi:predicted nucleic acid-binding Zn finger protein